MACLIFFISASRILKYRVSALVLRLGSSSKHWPVVISTDKPVTEQHWGINSAGQFKGVLGECQVIRYSGDHARTNGVHEAVFKTRDLGNVGSEKIKSSPFWLFLVLYISTHSWELEIKIWKADGSLLRLEFDNSALFCCENIYKSIKLINNLISWILAKITICFIKMLMMKKYKDRNVESCKWCSSIVQFSDDGDQPANSLSRSWQSYERQYC